MLPPPPPPVPSGVDAQSGQILFDGAAPPADGPSGAREPFPEAPASRPAQGPPMPARGAQGRPAGGARAVAPWRRPVSPFVAGVLGGATVWAALRLARWVWSRRR